MNQIYRVTVQGRTFESKDLRRLLARAVSEKRSLDQRTRVSARGCAQGTPAVGTCRRDAGCVALG
jgi:hypothetical protein